MKEQIVAKLLEAELITQEEADILLGYVVYVVKENMDDLLYTVHLN